MAKQSDYERINRLIILPISNTWMTKVPEGMVEGYVEDLAGFSDETLRAAFLEVRRTSKTPPRIAHFVEACRSLGGSRDGDSSGADDFYRGLRKRGFDCLSMAKKFVDTFEISEQVRNAKAEGWERPLLAFAFEAAMLQAQFMTRSPNPGFHQRVLTNYGPLPTEEIDRRCRDFVTTCKRQAATGNIDVRPPSYLIDEWRPRAA